MSPRRFGIVRFVSFFEVASGIELGILGPVRGIRRHVIAALSVFFFIPSLWATPAQIILIRHAEKPETGNELNERGWQRANALPYFFENNPEILRFGWPVALYAMSPKDETGSVRAIQTVTPLANYLGLGIHVSFKKNDVDPLMNEIMRA